MSWLTKEQALFQSLFSKENQQVLSYMQGIFYYKDPRFFSLTKYNENDLHSQRLYMPDEYFKDWVKLVVGDAKFTEKSYSKICEGSHGEYNNATLFSSSRMAIELFSNENNVKKLLNNLGLPTEYESIELEHRYYCDVPHAYSNIDVSIIPKNCDAVVAVECKMQEIFKDWPLLFKESYDSKLTELQIHSHKAETEGMIEADLQTTGFDSKQQICHYLGLSNYAKTKSIIEKKSKKVFFLNLVFNPEYVTSLVPNLNCEPLLQRYRNYLNEEQSFWEMMRETMEKKKEYDRNFVFCGQFNQQFEKEL